MKKLIALLTALVFGGGVAYAAGPGNPFLWNPGTGNNGLYTGVILLMSTELDSLGSGSGIVSSVNGSSGKFTNSNTGQAQWGVLQYVEGTGGTQPTCTAGANLAVWFMQTVNSTYETNNIIPPRAPDVILPLYVGTLTAGQAFISAPFLVPNFPFYVFVQNNCGAAFPAFGTTPPQINLGVFTPTY